MSQRRPRVFAIIDTLAIGGPGKGLLQLIENLRDEEAHLVVCTFAYVHKAVRHEFIEQAKARGVDLEIVEQRRRPDFSLFFRVLRAFSNRRCSVVQSHGYKGHVLAFLISKIYRVPWIAVDHGWTTEDLKVKIFHRLGFFFIRWAQIAVAVAPDMHARMLRWRGLTRRTVRILNAISPRPESPVSASALKEEFGINEDHFVIGVVGRLSPEKGHRFLLRALASMGQEAASIRTVFVGDGPERQKLVKLVEQYQLSDRVFFAGYRDSVSDFYQLMDLLVLPSLSEGLPNVVLEAMAHEVPVCATDVGSLPEMISDGENGWLVPAGDFGALEDSIQQCLKNPEAQARIVKHARQSLYPRYCPRQRAVRFLSIYNRLLAGTMTPEPGPIRKFFKNAMFTLMTYTVAPLNRLVRAITGRPQISVLVYHRVTDEVRDEVTVGVTQFEDQMKYLRRHCVVVSLEDLVRGTYPRRSFCPIVAVTFDDGYLDNFEKAAPILKEYHIPATFFLSTRMIGTEVPFKHDLNLLGHRWQAMSWKHARQLLEDGFLVGAHTASHINCAKAPLETVRNELQRSRQDLKENLGIESPHFAYPFGGKEHMTPEVLEVVKEEGFRSCSSAYGGTQKAEFDPYSIKRQSIDYRFSMPAFKARVEGLIL